MRRASFVCAVAAALALAPPAPPARADDPPTCRAVEVTLKPVPRVQMAVWIEDDAGNYVDTIYVTRLTGSLGLANRPGMPTFKSDYRFPYGSREMVMPVWAHKRNHLYGKVAMGGAKLDASRTRIGDTTDCAGDCRNDTIGYHFNVSSSEPFYCGPSGGTGGLGLDATSCASSFYGSKGAYLQGASSYYPPRADLTSFENTHDAVAAEHYASLNDLGAVSAATPPGNAVIDPPIRWTPPHDGRYVVKVEVSKEFDFNAFHDHAPYADGSPELRSFGLEDAGGMSFGQPGFKYGKGGFGQPSIVYAAPFTVGPSLDIETTSDYVGYGDWDGASGTLHGPDLTITSNVEGSGVGRLLLANDQSGAWRVKVRASADCGPGPGDGGMDCVAPPPPTNVQVTPQETSLVVSFTAPPNGAPPARYDVRYREKTEIGEGDFLSAIPPSSPPPAPGAPGSPLTMTISGLRPEMDYHVAVRAIAACDAASAIATAQATTTRQKFVTLHGCFIATAAYGTPLAAELGPLRRLRDRHLLTNPLGRAFVASYYALSPAVASVIGGDERLRAAARAILTPLVELARAAQPTQTP